MTLIEHIPAAPGTSAGEFAVRILNADVTPQSRGYFGCVEAMKDEIRGWVLHAGREDECVAVDILVDSERVATAYCVRPRIDIVHITGRHNTAGFAVPLSALRLPGALKDKQGDAEIRLTFRLREAGHEVPALFPQVLTVDALRSLVGPIFPRSLSMRELAEAAQPYVEDIRCREPAYGDGDVRLVAFYLPQFHPVPENDVWWGAGFTEWTNVSQGRPQFPGHYQPHVPGELGYYDLRLAEVREAQAELAKAHGIHGFCYYYYWFNGRRILERPLQEMLDSGKPDFPFCICWANETWSRRWDGSEHEVLLKQEHTPEGDVAFILDVIPLLTDARYIRVAGAPLLMVYRASLFPDLRTTADTWRRICAEQGIPQIHLCIVESFGFNDPFSVGFDSSVQFPPHGVVANEIRASTDGVPETFAGKIYDYEEVVENALVAPQPPHKRFDGVMVSWDNTARRKEKSHLFTNATPVLYEAWLRDAVERARGAHPPGERLVFINAWNEWAEGAHLEPDIRHGRAYLEATRRAGAGECSPDALLAHARKAGCLEGEGLQRWLADMEAAIRGADVRNRHAAKLVARNHALGEAGTIMSATPPYILRAMPLVQVGRFLLERVNGLPAGVRQAAVRRDQCLYLEGWAVHPDAPSFGTTVSHLVLECTSTKNRYFAPVFGRHARVDVAQALGEWPEASTLMSGLRAYIDLSAVETGEYRLGLLQAAESTVSLLFVEDVIRVC